MSTGTHVAGLEVREVCKAYESRRPSDFFSGLQNLSPSARLPPQLPPEYPLSSVYGKWSY